jgi:inner membrane protein
VASAITHFIVGASLALPAMRSRAVTAVMPAWAVPVTAGLLAVAPDLDTYLMRALDLRYGTLFSHRGFFHSALFLIAFSFALAALAAGRCWQIGFVWSICALTHPLLDMLTDGGSGVMLLFPFSDQRLFFGWRPIRVSPLGIARFFSRAGEILTSEAPFCAVAVAIGIIGLLAWPKATTAVDIGHRR